MRLNVDIRDSVYKEFVKNCDSDGRSISDVVRGLVIRYNADKRREELEIFELKKVERDKK